ncbi:MAG TPA: TraR/DksA family transcriptional regulator [Candidatus Saccharimonadales bacterium]|nr:TraR/DksA family transcriptional regulator [Candidatus Saccharimonadales bacterium]
MDKRSMGSYKKKLFAKRQELMDAYNRDKNYGRESDAGGTQDLADKASTSYTKEFLYSLSNSERIILQEVENALARIEEGIFGVCEECGENIHKKRLDAVPWARYCLACQEAFDKGRLQEAGK